MTYYIDEIFYGDNPVRELQLIITTTESVLQLVLSIKSIFMQLRPHLHSIGRYKLLIICRSLRGVVVKLLSF